MKEDRHKGLANVGKACGIEMSPCCLFFSVSHMMRERIADTTVQIAIDEHCGPERDAAASATWLTLSRPEKAGIRTAPS